MNQSQTIALSTRKINMNTEVEVAHLPDGLVEPSMEAVSELYDSWVGSSDDDDKDDGSCIADFLMNEAEEHLRNKRPLSLEELEEGDEEDDGGFVGDEDEEIEDEEDEVEVPECPVLEQGDLFEQLKKRLPSYMIPIVPPLRRRTRPNCLFINYLGTRRYAAPKTVVATTTVVCTSSEKIKPVFIPTSKPSDPPLVAPQIKKRKRSPSSYSPESKPTIAPTPLPVSTTKSVKPRKK